MTKSLRARRRGRLARMQEKTSKNRNVMRTKNRNAMRTNAQKTAARLGPYTASARDAASKRVVDAREWAAPRLEQAAESVQMTVAPRVGSALDTAAGRLEPTKAEAKLRSGAALAALQGKRLAKKKRRWPTAVLFFALGGAIGAGAAAAARKPEALQEARSRLGSTAQSAQSAQSSRPAASPDAGTEQARAEERAAVEGQTRG